MKINQIITEDSPQRAYQELKAGMEKWAENWDQDAAEPVENLEDYTGSSWREVADDIQEKWLPMFDNDEEALIRALEKIQSIHSENVISDFCDQYLQSIQDY
jgi:hypothetical protein